MKKRLLTLIGGLLLIGTLSSCGGSSERQADLANGETIYNKACIACHLKGVAGAAALDDKARWEEIAAKGMTTLLDHAVKGYTGKYGVMPEKGTCMDCTEQDLFDAISFMMDKAAVKPAN
ncbi:MAG: c-type cytochrome [Bacteroidetes bacterium]|nr:c-type cytochrome [Bacteroidota bacterium]MBU1580471.1 c-type cytochrome [Bacteroidota bacterium]MBU2558882.1 c-type cytochrome [Bacteroidota bacterium]